MGRDGLPIRQILHLQFPGQGDYRVAADVTVSFSRFGGVAKAAGIAEGGNSIASSQPVESGRASATSDRSGLAAPAKAVVPDAAAVLAALGLVILIVVQ